MYLYKKNKYCFKIVTCFCIMHISGHENVFAQKFHLTNNQFRIGSLCTFVAWAHEDGIYCVT